MRLADATVLSLRRLGDLNSYEAVMSVERTAAYARDLRDEITATMPVPIVFTVWQCEFDVEGLEVCGSFSQCQFSHDVLS